MNDLVRVAANRAELLDNIRLATHTHAVRLRTHLTLKLVVAGREPLFLLVTMQTMRANIYTTFISLCTDFKTNICTTFILYQIKTNINETLILH